MTEKFIHYANGKFFSLFVHHVHNEHLFNWKWKLCGEMFVIVSAHLNDMKWNFNKEKVTVVPEMKGNMKTLVDKKFSDHTGSSKNNI